MRQMRYAVLALVVLLEGCGGLQPVTESYTKPGHESRILGARIVHEAPDWIDLEVDYEYDGAVGECAFVGATTECSGDDSCRVFPRGLWAYTPGPIERGRHVMHTRISMNNLASHFYVSDQLRIELYEGGRSTFASAVLPYPKQWRRQATVPAWVSEWSWCKVESPRQCRRKASPAGASP